MSERGLASFVFGPSALCLKLQTKVRDHTNQGERTDSLLTAGENIKYDTCTYSWVKPVKIVRYYTI